MEKLNELLHYFEKVEDWKHIVKEKIAKETGGIYYYVTVTDIEVKYDDNVFHFPTKIVFDFGCLDFERSITTNEKVTIKNKNIKITERKKIYPISHFKRKQKYFCELHQIIHKIVGRKTLTECIFSNNLLSAEDYTLYCIDSKQKWSSYMLVLSKVAEIEKPKIQEDLSFLKNLLYEYGIRYSYDSSIQNKVIIIFPFPYLKVVANKVSNDEGNEIISLVIEFNEVACFFYDRNTKIEMDVLMKDTNGKKIYRKIIPVKYPKTKYLVVEIDPKKTAKIGYTSITTKINGKVVDYFANVFLSYNRFSAL